MAKEYDLSKFSTEELCELFYKLASATWDSRLGKCPWPADVTQDKGMNYCCAAIVHYAGSILDEIISIVGEDNLEKYRIAHS